ncbi:Na+/H+ antiporter subunit E, partial [Timonella senegalensis]
MARKVFKPVEVSTVVWLTVVWVLLWGDLTWGNIAGGLIIGLMVTQLMPLPRIEFKGHVRVRYLIALITRFLADLISASFQVAIQAFKFGTTPRGAIIGVKLRSESDLYLTLT